jgi:hypothetical protein
MSTIDELIEKLAPCPFIWCGAKAVLEDGLQDRRGSATEFAAGCRDCDVYTPQCATAEDAVDLWNMRAPDPALSTLLEQNRKLEEALKPFAECVVWISPEESDEEWAKFRLLIGDYRRAARALLSGGGEG